MKKYLISALLFILLASSAWSFDGNRKGFVLGGGLGFAPTAKWEVDGASFISESASGFGLNLLIGYAWDAKNMIVYEGNVVGYKPSQLDVQLTQGFNGAAWYHYFGETGKSFFTTVGLGIYMFEADGYDSNDAGGGALLGVGYEFSRHWQAAAYFSGGKTSDPVFDYKHNSFSVLISGLAF
ncbi:MAG TPA: hypothetical protein ENH23_04195 [candidate division Zixibacteria bacterium]|nr:hypothetical protein [candidate division Zixibacteria bacterium]